MPRFFRWVEKHHLSAHPRLLYMDFLRAIAILYVVAVHHLDDYAGNIYHNKVDIIAIYSFLGLFMFISGYLLSLNTPVNNKSDLWVFFRRRFLRIYPLYILALLLFASCSFISLKGVLIHIFLLNVLLGQSVFTLWFVSILCVLYIIYPIIVYKYSVAKTAIITALFYGVLALLKEGFGLVDERLLLYFPLFLLGVVSLKHNLIERYAHNRVFIAGSALVFAVSIFLYFKAPRFNQVFLVILMMSAVPLLVPLGKLASSIVKKSFYVNIAYASFCMYLFHRVIFYVITNIYSPSDNIRTAIYLTLLAVPVIYVVSFYLQKYYDQARRKLESSYVC